MSAWNVFLLAGGLSATHSVEAFDWPFPPTAGSNCRTRASVDNFQIQTTLLKSQVVKKNAAQTGNRGSAGCKLNESCGGMSLRVRPSLELGFFFWPCSGFDGVGIC